MYGAECWTDHRHIITKLNVHIQPLFQPQSKRLNISKLQSPPVRQLLYEDLEQKLPKLKMPETDVDLNWTALKDLLYSTALHHLGQNMHKHQDWFNENNTEIQKLLDNKYQAHWAYENDTSPQSKKDVNCAIYHKAQLHLRRLQDEWFSQMSDKIQSYDGNHNWKQFCGALEAVCGPQSSGSSPMLSADGSTLLTDKDKIFGRWAEHFNMLNHPSSINEEAIAHLPQVVINSSLANSPTVEGIRRAVKSLSTSKAPGSDAIPGELYILSRPNLIYNLTELFKSAWTSQAVPQEFKDATIVYLYRSKGN